MKMMMVMMTTTTMMMVMMILMIKEVAGCDVNVSAEKYLEKYCFSFIYKMPGKTDLKINPALDLLSNSNY